MSQFLTATQCKMARVGLDLTVRELAALADVSPTTVTKLEKGEGLQPRTQKAIRQALETAGMIFIDRDNGGGPGVRLRE